MKKTILTILGLAFASSLYADVVITTGSKKGSYYKYGQNLKGITGGTVLSSKGSNQNFDRLMSGKATVALGQLDAYKLYTSKHPEAANKIELVGLLKKECLYAVASTKSGITKDSQIQSKGVKVATGGKGSGSEATWKYMKQLESGFSEATGVPKGGSRALAATAAGTYDVYLSMQTPSVDNKLVKTVLSNPGLTFVDVTDWDLNDKLPSGEAVYTHDKIDVAKGLLNDTEIHTICTQAAVFVATDSDESDIESVVDAILEHKNYILGN